jgi:hypothetical protein
MNCGLCHEEETSTFKTPAETMFLMEAVMAKDEKAVAAAAVYSREYCLNPIRPCLN